MELGIHPSTLDSIKCKCFHDPENCLLQVLTEWLKTEEPTWKRLVEVLKGNTLKEFKVAQKIEEEYCRKLGECSVKLQVLNQIIRFKSIFIGASSTSKKHAKCYLVVKPTCLQLL